MKTLITLFLALVLSACNGGGGASNAGGPTEDTDPKSILSVWTSLDGNRVIDLSAHSLGTSTNASMFFADGSICDFQLGLVGTEQSVIGQLQFSAYRAATGPGDPGCAALDGNYRATVDDNDIMTLCDPPGWTVCQEYE